MKARRPAGSVATAGYPAHHGAVNGLHEGVAGSMAVAKEEAYLAHISDTVTAIEEEQGEQKQALSNILTILGLLLETNQAQSEMLTEILGAASQEAGPSPVAEALEALALRVRDMDNRQAVLIERVAELPLAIGQQFAESLRAGPTAAATPH